MLFNMGHIYWKYNHFRKALALYLLVVREHASAFPRIARTAAFRVVGMLVVQRQYRLVRRYVDQFMRSKELMKNPAFAARMRKHKRSLDRKLAQED